MNSRKKWTNLFSKSYNFTWSAPETCESYFPLESVGIDDDFRLEDDTSHERETEEVVSHQDNADNSACPSDRSAGVYESRAPDICVSRRGRQIKMPKRIL